MCAHGQYSHYCMLNTACMLFNLVRSQTAAVAAAASVAVREATELKACCACMAHRLRCVAALCCHLLNVLLQHAVAGLCALVCLLNDTKCGTSIALRGSCHLLQGFCVVPRVP
jgi:hypothetical protein